MGASLSTLGGWTIILCIAGYYGFRYLDGGRQRGATQAGTRKHRLVDRQNGQNRKDVKDKAKRQRGESYTKDVSVTDKVAEVIMPAISKIPAVVGNQKTSLSHDDGVDNREFARQIANVKQGTSFNGPKKDEKRQKSIRQSRAEEREDVSTPSSNAGGDGDDDESSVTSPEIPEIQGMNEGGFADMLEPEAPGPSVLRLTSSENVKPKQPVKTKEPEKTETKKQRQNRQKVEAAKVAREDAEKDRKVKLEAQRRLARVSEGRAAKDGSSFVAAEATRSAWADNGNNSTSAQGTNGDTTHDGFIPVQPLDTSSSRQKIDISKPAASTSKPGGWTSTMPSEQEQIKSLQDEDDWNTVPGKKTNIRKKAPTGDVDVGSSVTKPQSVVPVTNQPFVTKAQSQAANGRPSKTFTHQSSFAALSTSDEPEVEEEWDV